MAPDQDAPAAAPSVADIEPVIRGLAWRICRAGSGLVDLDDLTQTGLLAAHASLLAGSAYPAASQRSHAIARSQWAMLDLARVEGRHAQRQQPLAEAPEAGHHDTPEAQAARRQIARRVVESLDQLPARYVDVLRLTYADTPANHQVLADRWGVTRSRISQMHRQAIAEMRLLLGLSDDDCPTPAARAAAHRALAHAAA